MYVQISSKKRPFKNPAKSSERIGSGYSEAARGLGSSGRAAQLMWDWDRSRGVPRNTRNEEQICPSQVPSGATKNQKAWKVTIHEQKAGTSGNPEWRTIKGSGWENLQPSRNGFYSTEMDSAYLGKMTARKDNQKLSLKSKKPWRVKVSSPRTPRNGRSASGF